jgi:hypothetical protein
MEEHAWKGRTDVGDWPEARSASGAAAAGQLSLGMLLMLHDMLSGS